MQIFKDRSLWVIIISASFGAIYGVVAVGKLNDAGLSVWGVIMSVVCAAALCGCGGSALHRYFSVYELFHQHHKTPSKTFLGKRAGESPSLSTGDRQVTHTLRSATQTNPPFDLLVFQEVRSG